jgi:hypothetical protein
MFARLLRCLAVPLAAAATVMLTGLPDFTALDRAVSKALDSAGVQGGGPNEQPLTVLVPPRILVDREPVAPKAELTRPDPVRRAEQTHPDARPFGRRPGDGALVPLYASFVALQGLDVHSTLRAIDRGGREANQFMAPMTERPAVFMASKAGSTAGILYLTERVRQRSPTAAIVMMTAFNSAYAMVVANNYRIGNRLGQ